MRPWIGIVAGSTAATGNGREHRAGCTVFAARLQQANTAGPASACGIAAGHLPSVFIRSLPA